MSATKMSEYEEGFNAAAKLILAYVEHGAQWAVDSYKLTAIDSKYGSGKLGAYNDVSSYIENEVLLSNEEQEGRS